MQNPQNKLAKLKTAQMKDKVVKFINFAQRLKQDIQDLKNIQNHKAKFAELGKNFIFF